MVFGDGFQSNALSGAATERIPLLGWLGRVDVVPHAQEVDGGVERATAPLDDDAIIHIAHEGAIWSTGDWREWSGVPGTEPGSKIQDHCGNCVVLRP